MQKMLPGFRAAPEAVVLSQYPKTGTWLLECPLQAFTRGEALADAAHLVGLLVHPWQVRAMQRAEGTGPRHPLGFLPVAAARFLSLSSIAVAQETQGHTRLGQLAASG